MPLWTTYWGFGVLGTLVFNLLVELLEHSYFKMATSHLGLWIFLVLVWGLICFGVFYSLFISIAIWRSAGKYQGRVIWSWLARCAVIVGLIVGLPSLIDSFMSAFKQSGDSKIALEEELRLINKNLPSMIDDETRLDRAFLEGDDIYYSYTLINVKEPNINVSKFYSTISGVLREKHCGDKEIRALLGEGKKLIHVYQDKNHRQIATIVVKKKDCSLD